MFSFFKQKPLLSADISRQVAECIAEVEKTTSGEIRVFVESHCPMVNPLDRCEVLFVNLGMHETQAKNGVLIYVALKDRQFAVAGDKGINERVGGKAYWTSVADTLKSFLRAGNVGEGLCACVRAVGESLARHYPYTGGENPNELPDEIVFGK